MTQFQEWNDDPLLDALNEDDEDNEEGEFVRTRLSCVNIQSKSNMKKIAFYS